MLRTTRWSPDTCGCVLEYSWDDSQPQDSRDHSFARAVRICEAHASSDPAAAFEQVKSENVVKNIAQGEFAKAIPGKEFVYLFTVDRKLDIRTDHLSKNEQAKVDTDVISKLDSSKVERKK